MSFLGIPKTPPFTINKHGNCKYFTTQGWDFIAFVVSQPLI